MGAETIDSSLVQLITGLIVGPVSGLAGAWFIAWRFEKMYSKKDLDLTNSMQKQIDSLTDQNKQCHESSTIMQKQVFELMKEMGNVKVNVSRVESNLPTR